MSAILNLEEISVRRGDKTILGPLSWQVLEGQRWVVLGPNGAGKTTLLQICASLIHPTTGKIEILGQQLGKVDVFELRTRIGLTSSALVEQLPSDELVIDAVLTAAYAVLGRWQEKYDLWDESRAMALLTALGVRELGDRTFGTLSEGEKKRVQIARALMADPELLLLDEPASSLDLGGREDLLKRIEVFAKDPLAPATVIVTHHIEEIPAGTSHALLLKDGEVVASGDVNQVITDENLTSAYGLPIYQEDIFRALSIPPAHVKVVIVGQDPYPNPKYAMGMAFSVRENTNPLPASLKNIFTELEDDLGYKRTNGDLSDWKDQGVLLLNRSLTVAAHDSNSHIDLNWSQITEPIIESVARNGAIGILWGNQAAIAGKYFPKENVLTSAHPSPLSAYRGFFGSKPFSKSNLKLLEKGLSPIKW